MAPYISLMHRRGGSYRIDEMGAVTCTGSPGVSNSMATALWTVDALFDAARQGIDGVNLHTDYARINNLFSLRFTHGRWRATVRPIYYGALLFAHADPAGSRLLDVQGATTNTLRVWASRGRDRRVRITLINDSLDGAATVRLAAAGRGAIGERNDRAVAGTRRRLRDARGHPRRAEFRDDHEWDPCRAAAGGGQRAARDVDGPVAEGQRRAGDARRLTAGRGRAYAWTQRRDLVPRAGVEHRLGPEPGSPRRRDPVADDLEAAGTVGV